MGCARQWGRDDDLHHRGGASGQGDGLHGNSPLVRAFDGSRRHNYEEFVDACETVQAFYGTGGGNTPIIIIG